MNCGPSLLQPAEMRQGGGEIEVRDRKISVGLDGATQPRDRLLVGAEVQLGDACERQPEIDECIARTEAERLLDMSLGFLAATGDVFGETDLTVSVGQISI